MNLFFSTSPLQLICCLEAKSHYKTQHNILIIREEKTDAGKKQIAKLLDRSEWDYVIELKRSSKIWHTSQLIRKLKKMNSSMTFERVFFADYLAWRTNVVLANITAHAEIMLDDGTNTITTFNSLIETKQHVYRNKRSRDIMMALLGAKKARVIYPRDNFKLFTFFNLTSTQFSIERNEFHVLRSRLNAEKTLNPSAPAAFIGQGLVGTRGMKTDAYLSLLNAVSSQSPNGLLYFPHRSETADVAEQVKSVPGVKYQQTSRPIEFEIAEEGIQLSAIYGISSAASYTLSQIYSNVPVYDIEVPLEKYGMALLGETLERLRKEMGLPYAQLPKW